MIPYEVDIMLETNRRLWNWNLLWLFPRLQSRLKSSVVSPRFLSALGRFPVDGPWSSWPSLTQLIPLSLSPLTQTGSLACRACGASRNLSVLSGSSLFIPSRGLCHPAEREVKQGCVCGSFCSLHCVRPKCHLMDRKRREISMWLLLTMKWLKLLVANVSASQWCVHICIYHRLHTILAFRQSVSNHIHITSLWPDFREYRDVESLMLDLQAVKPATAVQDCVPTFVSVKPLYIFDQGPKHLNISKHAMMYFRRLQDNFQKRSGGRVCFMRL